MKFPKKETMKKYIKECAIVPAKNMCLVAEKCPICTKVRAYRKELRRTK